MVNVFISQPMTGLSGKEIREERMEAELEVRYAVKEEVKFCDKIEDAQFLYLCEGWEFSDSCRKDREFAVDKGMQILYC